MKGNHIRFLTFFSVIVVALWTILVTDGLAFRMVPMNLEEMADKAERIIVGTCTASEEGEMPIGSKGQTLSFTTYTFQVNEIIKGNVGQTLIIRQARLGGKPISGGSDQGNSGIDQPLSHNPIPLPEYHPGREVLLFLGADSSLGLTSPVAMDQAVFDAETENGKKFLRNRFNNRSLFRGMSVQQLAASKQLSTQETALFSVGETDSIPYETFISLVRKLIAIK